MYEDYLSSSMSDTLGGRLAQDPQNRAGFMYVSSGMDMADTNELHCNADEVQ